MIRKTLAVGSLAAVLSVAALSAVVGCNVIEEDESVPNSSALAADEKEIEFPAELKKYEFQDSKSGVVAYWRLSQVESPSLGKFLVFTGYAAKNTEKSTGKSTSAKRDYKNDKAVYEAVVPNKDGMSPIFRMANPEEPFAVTMELVTKLSQDFEVIASKLDSKFTTSQATAEGSDGGASNEDYASTDDAGSASSDPGETSETSETSDSSASDPASDDASGETGSTEGDVDAGSESSSAARAERVSCALGAAAGIASLISDAFSIAKTVNEECAATATGGWFNLVTGRCVRDTGREAMIARNQARARTVTADSDASGVCKGFAGVVQRAARTAL